MDPYEEPKIERPPVEKPESSPADELVEALSPRLKPSDEKALSGRIYSSFNAAIQDRTEWETRLAEWEDQYYGRVPDKDYPWPGSANFHVPLTMMGVETFKPRLVESILGQNPPLIVVPVQPAEEERQERTETFLNWQILTELNIAPLVAQSAHLFLQPGMAIAKTTWMVRRIRRKMVREFPLNVDLEHILEALFGTQRPKELDKIGEMEWEGELPTHGSETLYVKLRMKALENNLQILLEKEELVERPSVEFIEPIDFIAPARGGAEINDLPWCQHRLWMYEDEIRQKVLLKRFYADVVEEMLSATDPPEGDSESRDSTAYRQAVAKAEGIESDGPSSARQEQYEILEDYRRWDVDGDGLEEEIITWFSPRTPGRILGWDYLDNVYAHGRRPFRVGRFFPVPFRFYGLSFPEVVKAIQDEVNTIHNQRVDFATITNLPITYYRASMSLPLPQTPVKPGSYVPVDNPQQDLNWPHWNSNPSWAAQEEQTLHQYFERLTGLTDLTLGRQPTRVGATRTAAGTQTLMAEAGLRFKTAMEAFQRLWIGIFEDVLSLDQEYLPPGKEFRVTGKRPEFIKLKDRTEIRGRYDIRLAASDQTLNRTQMRNDASMVLQVLLNPALIQAGIIGLKGVQRAIGDFLKAFGKDPSFYLEPSAPIRSPEEELAMFVAGSYVSPTQGEDFQRHLLVHQTQLMDPELGQFLRPEVREKLKRHLQETMQLARAQQMAMMLQQGGGKAGQAPLAMQAGNVQQGQAAPQPQNPALQQSQATNLGAQGMNRGQS